MNGLNGGMSGIITRWKRIRDSKVIEVVMTDSIPLPPEKQLPRIKALSVAPLIGEAIRRIHRGESVGALFSSEVSFTQEMTFWDSEEDRAASLSTPPEAARPGAR